MPPDILADIALARRLERAEAVANARFVEARSRLVPGSGAQWIEIAGAYAMYDGPRSPLTQTFGLGLFQTPTAADMDKLEAFFKDRGAPVFHEISPLADKSLLPLLNERGYRPLEFTNVMFLPLGARVPDAAVRSDSLHVRIVGGEERELWARTAAEGWHESTGIAGLMFDFGRVVGVSALPFLAELDGQPVAAGALAIHGGVALLAGASKHLRVPPPGCTAGVARKPPRIRRELRVRPRHDLRRTGECFPTQCRAPELPHCLHAH